jgi:iron complex outermembrane recepter protein
METCEPENADTLVVGLVYQPSWLDGWRMSADWYDVQISDAIGTLGLQRIVDECELNGVHHSVPRLNVIRPSGFIGRIFNVPLNVAQSRVRGIDYEASYRVETNFFDGMNESFNMRFLGGYVQQRVDVPFGATTGVNTAGSVGTPDFTGVATGTYNIGPFSAQLQQRYIRRATLNPQWNLNGRLDVDINEVSSMNITNMQLAYNGDMNNGGTWRLSLNVNNLFDRAPPVQPNYGTRGGAQAVNNQFDIFGRRYQMSLNVSF